VPSLDEYYKGIQGDELDMDFATTDEEKREIDERKAGRVWRALRGSGRRFVLCEKIQYGSNLRALVERDIEGEGEREKAGDGEHDPGKEDGNGEHAKAEAQDNQEHKTETAGRSDDEPSAKGPDDIKGIDAPEEAKTPLPLDDVEMDNPPPAESEARYSENGDRDADHDPAEADG